MKVDFLEINVGVLFPQIDLIDKVRSTDGKIAKLKMNLVETDTDSFVDYHVGDQVVDEDSLKNDFVIHSFKAIPEIAGGLLKPPKITLFEHKSIWFAEYKIGFARYMGVGFNKDNAINYLLREYTRHKKYWEK